MTNGRRNELLSNFGPLAKSLTDSIVCSLQEQLHSIEESSSELLECVRVDVAGATRFGVTDGQLTKRTSVAKFVGLQTIDVKVCSPKGNCRLELTSPCGPHLVLAEVKQADDVNHYLRLVTTQPTDSIPVTAVKALIVVAAIPLTVDALYDVLDELAPLLRREVADRGSSKGQHDDGAASREETSSRRQQRRIEREEQKRATRRAREAAFQRQILTKRLTDAFKRLRVPAIYASLPILLAAIAFFYWDELPDWSGKKAHDIEALASWNGLSVTVALVEFVRELYQLVLNETRTTFHYVAGWLEHVGLRNEQRREFFEQLRTEADSDFAFLQWYFAPLTYASNHRLTFKGDPRDVDKVTQLMLDAVKTLIGIWMMPPFADVDAWDKIREIYGPLALEIVDDTPASYSFWKWWSITLAFKFKPFYRFLEENGFTWPAGGLSLEELGSKMDELPYIRFKL